MSRSASITLDWADGTYDFALRWGEIELLQEACNAGPYVILGRLQSGTWLVGDISHTVRLGLVGGGMKPADALKLVRQYVQDRPPAENLIYAQIILSAGCYGAPEEPVGESDAANPEGNPSIASPTES